MPNRKLGRASDQRSAMLRNLTTALLWNGKIVTTEARAKEIRPIAEKLITLAVKEYKNTATVEKETRNDKQQVVKKRSYVREGWGSLKLRSVRSAERYPFIWRILRNLALE